MTVSVDVLTLEIPVEQRVVLGLLDDRLDQGPAPDLDGRALVAVGVALHPGPLEESNTRWLSSPIDPTTTLSASWTGRYSACASPNARWQRATVSS